jgi:hypothetical protein
VRKILSALLTSALLSAALPAAAAQDPQPQTQSTQAQTQQAEARLTNKDVVDMVKAGLTSAVVVAKIKGSASGFDTSPAALQELKSAGVPDEVMLVMVQAASAPAANAALTPTGTAAVGGEPVEVKVPDGTEIEVELKNNVSGQEVKVGDIVDLTVVRPVQVNGVTVIDKGASARARITTAKKAGHWGKAGKLEWTMQDVQAVDGNRLPARFTKRDTGDSKGGTVATATVVTAVLFFPAAPLWGFKKGKPAVVPAGTRYTVFASGDTGVRGKAAPAAPAQ